MIWLATLLTVKPGLSRVLVMSALMGVDDMVYRMGPDAFMSKSFDLEDIWAEIEKLLLEECRPVIA